MPRSVAIPLIFSIALATCHDAAALGEAQAVLFIGNSLTGVNDLPGTVAAVAERTIID